MEEIPIVDLSEIGESKYKIVNTANWKYVASEIREGLGNIGFVYLKNHGIDQSLIANAFVEMQKFFELDKDVKLKYKKPPPGGDFSSWCGYTEPGEELLHPNSLKELRETYDVLHGTGVYPDTELPAFSEAFRAMYDVCNALAKKILVLIAISLDLDPKFFLNFCTHIDDMKLPRSGNLRALHYPPIPTDMHVELGTVRLGEHSDYALLTFLFQDMVGGLEVQTVDRKWIAATPIPNTILVNTGDLLEFWTAGVYPATKHRVTIPQIQNQNFTARYSIAYFLAPNVDTEVRPLKIKKKTCEEKRLAAYSRRNYGEMNSVTSMEYVLGRIAAAASYNQK